ncbi:MAG: hypothetical protein M0D57_21350 [Sphingobacteriales bacterium JAD_PAG50586_3]|nr:MAG: hypothetical protein M0D57_21350 [Sphingobacteriales bacterium JAD_PAG50586_3]
MPVKADFEEKSMPLTDEEIASIEKGIADIKAGRVITLENSNIEIDRLFDINPDKN